MPPKAAYAYNPRGFVADLRNTAPQASGGATIAEFGGTVGTSAAMAYDGVGNRTGMTNTQTGPTSYAYAYNSANELTQEQRVNPTSGTSTATYGYDGAQNRTSLNGSAIGHNQDNQFSDTTHYGYDGNGNPTGYTSPGNPVSGSANVTTFDPENRMTGYGISGSSALLNATYDSDGLRASKTGSSGTTYYVYDQQDRPVVELNASGVTTFVNTFGDNGLLSRRDVANSLTTYYAFDPQGSAVDVMQGNNGLPAAYSAFGIPASGGASSSPFGFGAQWGYSTDAETGLILCTHRYYDPYTGRFVNRDPIGCLGSVNLYNYVNNNAINASDSYGYSSGDGFIDCVKKGIIASIVKECGGELRTDPTFAYDLGMCIIENLGNIPGMIECITETILEHCGFHVIVDIPTIVKECRDKYPPNSPLPPKKGPGPKPPMSRPPSRIPPKGIPPPRNPPLGRPYCFDTDGDEQ